MTINCARLGYQHQGDEAGCCSGWTTAGDQPYQPGNQRKVIQRHMDNGLFPYTKRYLGTLRNHFSTIGINGLMR